MKVRFCHPDNGNSFDIKLCKDLLVLGDEYDVSHISIGDWRTEYLFTNVPGFRFNSVNFEKVEDNNAV